jgi:chemotaxis protein CheC
VETLTEGQLPLLENITEAGSNHAAIALSQLLNRPVQTKNTRIQWLNLSSLHTLIDDPDASVAALSIRVFGEARGNIVILFPQNAAQNLVMQLNGHTDTKFPFAKALDVSAIKEAGNILAGAYLSGVSNTTNIVLLTSVPTLLQDTAQNTMRFILDDWNLNQREVCIMQTELVIGGAMTCRFYLIPDKNFVERTL